jgi:hypothetical protein
VSRIFSGENFIKCRWKAVFDYETVYYEFNNIKNLKNKSKHDKNDEGSYIISYIQFIDFPLGIPVSPGDQLNLPSCLPPPFLLVVLNLTALLFTVDGALCATYGVPLFTTEEEEMVSYDLSYVTSVEYLCHLKNLLSSRLVSSPSSRNLSRESERKSPDKAKREKTPFESERKSPDKSRKEKSPLRSSDGVGMGNNNPPLSASASSTLLINKTNLNSGCIFISYDVLYPKMNFLTPPQTLLLWSREATPLLGGKRLATILVGGGGSGGNMNINNNTDSIVVVGGGNENVNRLKSPLGVEKRTQV